MKQVKAGDPIRAPDINTLMQYINDSGTPNQRGAFDDGAGNTSPRRELFRDSSQWVQVNYVDGDWEPFSVLRLNAGNIDDAGELTLVAEAVTDPEEPGILVTNGQYDLVNSKQGWVKIIGRHRPVKVRCDESFEFEAIVGPGDSGYVTGSGTGLRAVSPPVGGFCYVVFLGSPQTTSGNVSLGCGSCGAEAGNDANEIATGIYASDFYKLNPWCTPTLPTLYPTKVGETWVYELSESVSCSDEPMDVSIEVHIDGTAWGDVYGTITIGGDSWDINNDSGPAFQPRQPIELVLKTNARNCPCGLLKPVMCLIPLDNAV